MSYNLDQILQKSTCWYDVIPYCTENVGKEKKIRVLLKTPHRVCKKKQQKKHRNLQKKILKV